MKRVNIQSSRTRRILKLLSIPVNLTAVCINYRTNDGSSQPAMTSILSTLILRNKNTLQTIYAESIKTYTNTSTVMWAASQCIWLKSIEFGGWISSNHLEQLMIVSHKCKHLKEFQFCYETRHANNDDVEKKQDHDKLHHLLITSGMSLHVYVYVSSIMLRVTDIIYLMI
jgi:hypothetical protein